MINDMNDIEFYKKFQEINLKHPSWCSKEFMDSPCALSDIHFFEKKIGLSIPSSYRAFLTKIGGGYVGFVNVFSMIEGSEWNLSDRNEGLGLLPKFLAISDDETGGYYGFKMYGSSYEEGIYYLDPDENNFPIKVYPDFYTYILDAGLKFEQ